MKYEIRIFNKDDRLKIAGILIDNGYRVEQGKRRKADVPARSSTAYDHYLVIEDVREANSE